MSAVDLEQAIAAHQTAKADREKLIQTLASFRAELAALETSLAMEQRGAARRLLMTGEADLSPETAGLLARIDAIKTALGESDALLREADQAEREAWRAVQACQHGERLTRFNTAADAFQPVKAAFAGVLATWAEYRGLPANHVEAVFSDLMFNRREVLT